MTGLQKAPQGSLSAGLFSQDGKVLRGTGAKAGLLISGYTEMQEKWGGGSH